MAGSATAMPRLFFCAWVCAFVPLARVLGAPNGAAVESVPGFSGDLPSRHFAGYVSVNDTNGRELFYYFVESEGSPATDPVVLWLNGGPGCSSFDGFVYEHGPFKFEAAADSDSLPKLTLNPYAWSKAANILYLDSPAGVGFSYSQTPTDYITGDLQTALDTHAFLLKWFQAYPEYQSNPFFISGESYAGIYVPTLSRNVAHGIKAGVKPVINFKGYLVGNGCTDDQFDGDAIVPFIYGMGLISVDMYKSAQKACNGSYWNASDPTCLAKLNDIYNDVEEVNIYDILEPCYYPDSESDSSRYHSRLPQSFRRLGETKGPHKIRKRQFGRAYPLRLPLRAGRVPTWPSLSHALFDSENVPCTDDRIAGTWLNNAEVRAALHAKPAADIGPWDLCTDNIIFYHDAGSMIPIHRELTTSGYRALIYSGDHDMCVPYTGSEAWTSSMGYEVTDQWRAWFVGRQVAGFTQGYANNLTFATIKGSGHTVPEYKPAEALAFFQRFLSAQPL
ncbi:serine carboxypeptidase 1 [Physcomitrium patens]|uniref:Carboxypeptidase n=1 Tax=Physcomitrium patens TaxID=3218 RepID=A0A2K1K4G9_PHYPA|nr:serine carboxypeptidase 1-like [Physcomitrium patens]PNR48672.1 hypothetical protein PHYPA_013149 [Physcomitrium patens]|eukprot:XP_024384018.1 serine carboxypeptidase 1-like [Physcomitrella patens]